jgi:hypothetical protein
MNKTKTSGNIYNKTHIAMILIVLSMVSVISYTMADQTIFRDCFLHLKMFRDSSFAVDTTSIVLLQPAQSSIQPVVSLFGANASTNSIRQVMGKKREECSLQIIIGLHPSDSTVLYNFMYKNPYTFSSGPNSIYLIIFDPLTNSVMINDHHTISLPVSIFISKIPTFKAIEDGSFKAEDLYFEYYCVSCNNQIQPLTSQKEIRFLTDYSYQRKWKQTHINMQGIVHGRRQQITRCEQHIWKKWLAPTGKAILTYWTRCNKPAAFWDLTLRSVHPNFSTYLQTEVRFSQPGFSGSFAQNFYAEISLPSVWEASSSYYAGSLTSGIIYCDCKRKSESVSCETLDVGFGTPEWTIFIGTAAIISGLIGIKDYYWVSIDNKPIHDNIIEAVINVLGIILRQGSNKGLCLAIFSLGMYYVTMLFENTLTSNLVVPKKNLPFDLAELMNAGYRILIPGQSENEFGSHLPFLKEEFKKLNLTFSPSVVEIFNTERVNNPRTFIQDKFSYFFISTESGKDVIHQAILSKVSRHCVRPWLRNTFSRFPVYTFFRHKLTFRIFQSIQLLTEAGLHNFFDWDLERIAPDLNSKLKNRENSQPSPDSFISLKNLIPLLLVSGFLLLSSFLAFSIEHASLVYHKLLRTYRCENIVLKSFIKNWSWSAIIGTVSWLNWWLRNANVTKRLPKL